MTAQWVDAIVDDSLVELCVEFVDPSELESPIRVWIDDDDHPRAGAMLVAEGNCRRLSRVWFIGDGQYPPTLPGTGSPGMSRDGTERRLTVRLPVTTTERGLLIGFWDRLTGEEDLVRIVGTIDRGDSDESEDIAETLAILVDANDQPLGIAVPHGAVTTREA